VVVEVSTSRSNGSAEAPPRRRLYGLVRAGVTLVVIAAVAYSVFSQWTEVKGALAQIAWQSLVLALLAVLAGMGCNVMAYRHVLHSLGSDVARLTAGRVLLIGQLGKYLPGSVWAYVLQMELGRRAGIPRAKAFIGSLVATGLAIVAALLIGVISLPALADAGDSVFVAVVIVAPVALACAHPRVLTLLVNAFLRLIRKAPLSQPFAWPGIIRAVGWSGVAWTFFGAQLWLLVDAITGPGLGGFARCVGAIALAITAGLVAFFVPSGIGAREAVIVAALLPYTTPGVALGLALASRLIFTIADVIAAGAAALLGWLFHDEQPSPGSDVEKQPRFTGHPIHDRSTVARL
jgi:glycosyltransferase 2 family protein